MCRLYISGLVVPESFRIWHTVATIFVDFQEHNMKVKSSGILQLLLRMMVIELLYVSQQV